MNQPIFCLGKPVEKELFACIEKHIMNFGEVSVKHDNTQSAFVRKVQFAWVSMPRRKSDADMVMLSIGLPFHVDSPRIIFASEVSPGRWMHHMLVRSAEELQGEIDDLLQIAWSLVGSGRR